MTAQQKTMLAIGGGFLVGTLIGIVYGRGVRENAPDAVATSFDNGVLNVAVDTKGLIAGGVRDLFNLD